MRKLSGPGHRLPLGGHRAPLSLPSSAFLHPQVLKRPDPRPWSGPLLKGPLRQRQQPIPTMFNLLLCNIQALGTVDLTGTENTQKTSGSRCFLFLELRFCICNQSLGLSGIRGLAQLRGGTEMWFSIVSVSHPKRLHKLRKVKS